MFVLDTNVISGLRRPDKADPGLKAWADATPLVNLYISAITVLELELGTLMMERRDAVQGSILRAWMDGQVTPRFADRVLGVDADVARRCAALHVPGRRGERDALIAATALVHGMVVVTRNAADFAATGVEVLNPWA